MSIKMSIKIAYAILSGVDWQGRLLLHVPVCPYCGEQHWHKIWPWQCAYGDLGIHRPACRIEYSSSFAPPEDYQLVWSRWERRGMEMICRIRNPWRVADSPEKQFISFHVSPVRAKKAFEEAKRRHAEAIIYNERVERLHQLQVSERLHAQHKPPEIRGQVSHVSEAMQRLPMS